MAGHRSPSGRRARRYGESVPARHLIAGSPPPVAVAPRLRTTILATAAAIGSVATGTFTALLPTPEDGTVTSASADEPVFLATLSADSTSTTVVAASTGFVAPVTIDDGFATSDQHLAMLGKASDIAAQIAEQHAQQQREQAERDRLAAIISQGGVDAWIAEALQILDLPQSYAPGIEKIIMAESGGNPRAINNWDSNARRGTPSQGLMQTIPSTFRAFVHPDLAGRPITDPIANITAGVRYMIATYGTDTLESGGRTDSDGDYIGY